jgi:starch synthase (maltosyl-transferring)
VNGIRQANRALQSDWSLKFHSVDNDALICYSKADDDLANVILTVVNLDPYHTQSGWVTLDLALLGVEDGPNYEVHDLLSGAKYSWQGHRIFVRVDPCTGPAHIFSLQGVRRSALGQAIS